MDEHPGMGQQPGIDQEPAINEQLLQAVIQGDQEQVQLLLQQGASVHALFEPYGRSVLHEAAEVGQLEMVQLLVAAGADPDCRSNIGDTAIHAAAAYGHVGVAAFLLGRGASPSATDDAGHTPLYYASVSGHTAMIQLLLCSGLEVDAMDAGGAGTSLHTASFWGHHQAVSLLLSSGAAVDSVDADHCTPLHYACEEGHLDAVRVLLGAGAAVNALDVRGWTPVCVACLKGRDEVVELLLQRGAQPDVRDHSGSMALHIASGEAYPTLVRRLLQIPQVLAHINTPNVEGSTPLSLACWHNNSEVVQLLVAAGADVSVMVKGLTPLHIALWAVHAEGGSTACIEVLLAAGADANALVGAGGTFEGTTVVEGDDPLYTAMELCPAAVLLLATPTNMRRVCEEHSEIGLLLMQLGEGVITLLCDARHGAAGCVERVVCCFTKVLDVLGASELDEVLKYMQMNPSVGAPNELERLLEVAHSKWLSGMPWLQRKWRVTHRLQHLVIQPLQQQQQQQQDANQGAGRAAAAAGKQEQQVSTVRRQPSDVCLRLWTEAEAAADDWDWRLFVARLQQLVVLKPAWATYPLAEFAQRRGNGAAGVAGLCAALLAAWCKGQQEQPATSAAHAQEVRDAVLAAVQACQQQQSRRISSWLKSWG